MKELHAYCNAQGISCREGHDLTHTVCCYQCAKELEKKLKQETIRREEAEKIVEFYADPENSDWENLDYFDDMSLTKYHITKDGEKCELGWQQGNINNYEDYMYGKRAREYKAKYKEEK